jgi:hypothetical protein
MEWGQRTIELGAGACALSDSSVRPIDAHTVNIVQELNLRKSNASCMSPRYSFREGRANLRTGRQRQEIVRLLSIRHRFEVLVEGLAAVSTHCDDYVYPVTRWSLDVEHVSSIFDARNSLVLR